MIVTAWNNGSFHRTGAGYGLRIDLTDRDTIFNRAWSDVLLDLPSGLTGILMRISPSFWRQCPELRSAAIGKWLISVGHSRWPKHTPPTFTMVQVQGNHFRIL